jgi:hypothetical protein
LWSPNTPVFSIAVSGCSIYYGTDGGLYRGVIGGTMVEPRGDQFVRGIAIDGQYVYFADQVGGEIRRVGASGGTSELLVGELSQPWQIAIDDDTVYYVTSSQVGAVPKEGGVAGILASRGPDDPSFNPYHLAVSEDHVYYATASELRRVPKAGGNSQVIAAGASVGALAIHRCTLFVVESQDDVTARLISLSIDGGQPKVLATGPYGPYGGSIAVDDDNVYWNDGVSDSGRVLQVPRDGGEPIELGNDLQYPLGVVSTTLDVIWAEGVSGGTTHFHRVPIGGC